ncbi:MAG: hypothetical protein NZ473_06345 [Candidatus Kapabacteria bacterium]|nr:hypothetical protein [Candidatus Kapabacteria bacterium]MCS7169141.1 hypothetical protein [Candidatus Kapabacteria bacterium]MDW7996474.1 hypothetical protein [Bacteroidota bacterium]
MGSQPEPQSADKFAWLKGFAAVVTTPAQLVDSLGVYAGKVFVMALLIMTAASVLTNWFHTNTPALRHQLGQLVEQRLEVYIAKHPELTAEQQSQLRQRLQEGLGFSLPRSLVGGLINNTVMLLSLLGLLWLLQPVLAVRWSALSFAVLVTALGYVSWLGAAGEVLSAALQVLGQSLQVQPSLGAFWSAQEEYLLFSVLSRVHLGAVAQFGLLGFVLARAAALPTWRGMLWSYAAWGMWLGAIYGVGALMQ